MILMVKLGDVHVHGMEYSLHYFIDSYEHR